MNKGLNLIQRQQPEITIDGFPTGNIFIGVTEEELTKLEKELRALEIIKNKKVDIPLFIRCSNLEDYNGICTVNGSSELTQEEYDSLKGALFNEEES